MKIKHLFIVIISVLMLISLSQVFTIPPYADDIFPIYKSGYFSELDRVFKIIKDSFIGIKTLKNSAYAWIFLKDIEKKNDLAIKVYNYRGHQILAPGVRVEKVDKTVLMILNSARTMNTFWIRKNRWQKHLR